MARDDLPAGLLGNDAVPAEGPPKGETGIVTQQAFGRGWASFVDEMEYVPELAWPSSVIAYHRMRSDSQVEALHTGTSQPVREFRWSIDPNKADTKIVEQAAADLGLPIRGEEDEAIPRARNSFDFDTFLADALLSMLYGHFHFEVVGDTVEAQEWRMDRLSPRHPRTIADFKQSQNGDLEAIRQNIAPWGQLPPPIPGFKLIDFVWRSEAGSLVGRSLLRSIYREWMVKDRTIRVAAINLERGAGVPVVEGPPGASDKQIADLAELARQFKVAEGGGGAIPFGSKLTLVGGAIPEAINLLKYCDECMARVWALMLVQLGMTQTGNRALGAEFAIYAARAQRAIAKWIATRVNRFLDNYAEWNDPFAAYAPLLHYEQSKPDSMSITDFVALVDAKALIVDPELEAWLRAEHGLPKWPQGLARPTPESEGEEGQQGGGTLPSSTRDPTSESPTLAKGASANPTHIEREFNGIRASLTLPDRPMRRSPNDGEIRAAVDFAGLDAAHSTASNKLVQAFLGEIIPQQAKEVGDAIRSLPTLSRSAAASLRLAPIGEGVLHQHLLEAAKSGVATAARELEAQGVAAVRPDEAMLASRIADQAQAMAALNANGVSLAAQRKAQSLVSTATAGRSPAQIAAEVESHLLGMKHAWTREQLRGAVTMAQNQGRIATFTESRGETEPTYQASELLDDRTCDPCAAIDGKVYANLEEAEADYAAGGYVDCEGGPNCRGTLVAVHDEQNPKGGEGPLNEPEPPYDRPSGEAEEPVPGEPEIPGIDLGPAPEPTPEPEELPPQYPTMHLRTAEELLGEPDNYPDLVIRHAERLVEEAPATETPRPGVSGEAVAPPLTEGIAERTPAFEASFERTLESGEIDTRTLGQSLGGSVNSVYKTTVGREAPVEVYVKPEAGTRDFIKAMKQGVPVGEIDGLIRDNVKPGHDMQRERAAYLIAKRMGVPVPTTVVRDLPGKGPSLLSRAAEGREAALAHATPDKAEMKRMALFDSVVGNTDRHAGNYLIDDDGHITPIDHGLTFPDAPGYAWGNYQAIERTAWRGADSLITDDERTTLEALLADEVKAELKGTGMSDEAIRLFEQRTRWLLDEGGLRTPEELFGSSGELRELPGREPVGPRSSALRREVQEAKELSEEMAANRARRAREVIDEIVVGKEHEILANPKMAAQVHERAQELIDFKAAESERIRKAQANLAREILAEPGNPMGADLDAVRRIIREDEERG